MEAPLKGIRVLELARILAGPWIGQTLAISAPTSSRSRARPETTPGPGDLPS